MSHPGVYAAGGGAIVNVASTSGVAGNWNQGAYVASKHAVEGLTKAAAIEYALDPLKAGVYPFICKVHPVTMVGEITVK